MHKARSPQTTRLPFAIKDRIKTELPALVALSAIGESWFSAEHQADLLAVALVVRELSAAGSLQGHCAAKLQSLCEEAITSEHKIDIALNLAECLPWLQLQPNARVQGALKTVLNRRCLLAA